MGVMHEVPEMEESRHSEDRERALNDDVPRVLLWPPAVRRGVSTRGSAGNSESVRSEVK